MPPLRKNIAWPKESNTSLSYSGSAPAYELVPHTHGQPSTSDATRSQTIDSRTEKHVWPREARKLQRWSTTTALVDLLCLLMPAPFFALVYICATRDGKLVHKEDLERIQEGIIISATAFPLIFSAVVGRMTKRITSWRLERGSSLRSLELLNGSTTLINSISTYLSLRHFNLLGASLVLLWAVSPLGGQSPLQVLRTRRVTSTFANTMSYLNMSSPGHAYFGGTSSTVTGKPFVEAVYYASLLAPANVKSSGMDAWGNVKIPFLPTVSSLSNHTGWVDLTNEAVNYSSLAGVPIMGLEKSGNVSFVIPSTYFVLERPSKPSVKTIRPYPPVDPTANLTGYRLNGQGFSSSYRPDYIDVDPILLQTKYKNVSVLELGGMSGKMSFNANNMNMTAYFQLNQVYIEAVVVCSVGQSRVASSSTHDHSCSVRAMRRRENIPEIAYNWQQWLGFSWTNMISYFSQTTMNPNYSIPEAYIRNPDSPLAANLSDPSTALVDWDTLTLRLSQLFNTYAFGSLDPTAIIQSSSSKFSNETGAHGAYFNNLPVYTVNWVWLSIFSAATSILTLCALTLTTLHFFTLNPDILGYVSTATMYSSHLPVPPGGSTLNGEERARLLKDMAIRLGDVQQYDLVTGQLSFGTISSAARPHLGRLYS
ncbi:hypothetical protein BDV23DRAFT_188913 [Aspergillus alliaceus]|uniref:Uncharacterized protein n=1 Tax=Petromyces alliaceus TaxID=209559 RepID=A0A5N7BSC7_PETAA|nr:hypothetical protein BDV23DRAFT_188913 [Aspergillus alliaceus]